MKKIFLGGTCNESKWRDELIPLLKIDYFNPVVKLWDKEAHEKEISERENCDYCLYVITPKMTGMYSIAELVDDSNKRPEKTIFCFLKEDEGQKFTDFQIQAFFLIGRMVEDNGARYCDSLEEVANMVNS